MKIFFPPVSRLKVDVLNLAYSGGSHVTINKLLYIWAISGFGPDDLFEFSKLFISILCPYPPSVSSNNSNNNDFPFPPHPRNIVNFSNVCPNNILANICLKKSIWFPAISIRIFLIRFLFLYLYYFYLSHSQYSL